MVYLCPSCGARFRCDSPGVVSCPACGAKVMVPDAAPPGTAWDRARQGGFAGAFFETIKFSLSDPVGFFGGVDTGESNFRAWLYALIISCVVFVFAAAYQAGFQALAIGFDLAGEIGKAFTPLAFLTIPVSLGALVGVSVVAVPSVATLVLFLQSGVYHLCLLVLGEGKGGFWKSFRVVCYSNGPQVFQIVPFLGGLVAPVWQMVLAIVGMKVVHRTSYARSVVAVFLPTILCCGLVMLALIALLGGVVGAAVVRGG